MAAASSSHGSSLLVPRLLMLQGTPPGAGGERADTYSWPSLVAIEPQQHAYTHMCVCVHGCWGYYLWAACLLPSCLAAGPTYVECTDSSLLSCTAH